MYESQAKTIGDLLSNNLRARIVVPRFQRGYSWERKHVSAFWHDISQFVAESAVSGGPSKYFLGPIVRMEQSSEVTSLLDGQQRLATATILLAVVREKARNLATQDAVDFARDVQREMITKGAAGYALELSETDRLYFEETVQNDPPIKKTAKLRSHRNIAAAKKVLTSSVSGAISSDDPVKQLAYLRNLFQVIRSDLVMASIPVQSERDAFKIFETLNDRGLRLSVPDLLLNHLMGSAGSDEERRQIRSYWNEMLEQMGRRDINRFLRHFWISQFGDLKSVDLFSALKKHIEDGSQSSLAFARDCAGECEAYAELLDADDQVLKLAAPYVRALTRQLDVQAAMPLLMSCFRLLPIADLVDVVRLVLVFVTRYSVISRLDSAGVETVLFALARDVRGLLSKEGGGSAGAGTPSPAAIKKCLAHIKDVLRRTGPTDDVVTSAMADLMLDKDDAKYLLSRIASYMQTSTKEVKIDEANLEHVFPRNAKDADWGGKANVEKLEQYTWHVGNLTMLGERINREAGNKSFAVKRVHYAAKSELQMAQQVGKYTKWGVREIENRAKTLAPFAVKIWNFDNPSRV